MRYSSLVVLLLGFSLGSCQFSNPQSAPHQPKSEQFIQPEGTRVLERIMTPEGFERTSIDKNSFAHYLRTLPLKPHDDLVHYYHGGVKPNIHIYEAVVDLSIGKKDLHQCADAIMRLRAEYLWNAKKYDEIHFNFTNGYKVDYKEWMKGRRMVVEGNKTYWNNISNPSNNYADFWNYMELIFMYAGTSSLSKELSSVSISDMKIGDVFIKGGFPGHAVIVIDVAQHSKTKEKIYLLAQSYMPAQELQILTNNQGNHGPWYPLSTDSSIVTPEWTFYSDQLMRFK